MADAIIIMCVHCFTIAPSAKNAQWCHTHCHIDLPKARHRQGVRWYVRDVLVLCMHALALCARERVPKTPGTHLTLLGNLLVSQKVGTIWRLIELVACLVEFNFRNIAKILRYFEKRHQRSAQ